MFVPGASRRGGLLFAVVAAAAALTGVASAEDATKTTTSTSSTVTPCVATNTNGAFFDLRPDVAVVVSEDEKPPKGVPTEDYIARGWDYGYNFTLNICDAVVNPVEDVVGVEKPLWRNVSAYYKVKGRVYSLGQQSGELVPRGRKLVLQYTGGSPCGPKDKSRDKRSSLDEATWYNDEEEDYLPRRGPKSYDDDDDDDDYDDEDRKNGKNKDKDKETTRRKSATISFLCDHDPDTPTAVSFVGADPDLCAYFFEVRSQHACATAEPHKPGSVGPGSVFAIIFFIAVLVYLLGGVFYQRTVAHARGWRQLPNYSMWASIWNFLKVCFSCTFFFSLPFFWVRSCGWTVAKRG
jgi:cation-dependent mannose-6-phosphate receptor